MSFMQTLNNRDIQRVLSAAGYYAGDIDGDLGPKSLAGIQKLLSNRSDEVSGRWATWSTRRQGVAALQLILKHAGFANDVGAIDGLVGPSTLYALSLWDHKKLYGDRPDAWRKDSTDEKQGQLDLPIPASKTSWPKQNELRKFYGEPGGAQCTAGVVQLPFKMKIAWDKGKTITSFKCHEKVATSIERALQRIQSEYSPEQIVYWGFDLWGGCFNYRQMRGGSSLSTHAWGIAIDFDPERNQLKWGPDRANFAKKGCEEFFRAWSAEGWTALGPARGYDYMHVQAAGLN